MDDARDESVDVESEMVVSDPELRTLLGMFDMPAFARRGQDLDDACRRLRDRCRREREGLLDMARLRLRQWAAASRPDDWSSVFLEPIDRLWPLTGAEAPVWSAATAPLRRRRAIGRDLVLSVERFNRRWSRFVAGLQLAPINTLIDQYNRYYLLEKECCLGSARIASRHFETREPITTDAILAEFPTLPVPTLRP